MPFRRERRRRLSRLNRQMNMMDMMRLNRAMRLKRTMGMMRLNRLNRLLGNKGAPEHESPPERRLRAGGNSFPRFLFVSPVSLTHPRNERNETAPSRASTALPDGPQNPDHLRLSRGGLLAP